MKIFIKAKPGAKAEKIERVDETTFTVSVRERAVDNEANWAVVKAIAGYFGKPISSVRLVSGRNSRNKVIEID